jgi:hypothetical protein
MITLSFSLALIAIVYGAKLLAQSQKDNLGALYKYLAWFIILMGFLVLLCDGARGLLGMCHRGDRGMMDREYRMRGDDGMMGGGGCQMMMHCHRGDMMYRGGCCDGGGMMNCREEENCQMHSDGGCSDGIGSCKDGGMNSCKDDGKGTGCPMMGGMKDKKDSVKAKK